MFFCIFLLIIFQNYLSQYITLNNDLNIYSNKNCNCFHYEDYVCGTYNKTFLNSCFLNCYEDILIHRGKCKYQCFCDDTIDYVCGLNNKSYKNHCQMNCDNQTQKNLGKCQGECNCENIYKPICSKNGRTFENECIMKCNEQVKRYDGDCTQPKKQKLNRLCVCPDEKSLKCSIKNITYQNGCELNCANDFLAYDGKCLTEKIEKENQDNKENKKKEKDYLKCDCKDDIKPVCGQNNETYSNYCIMECQKVKIKSFGVCKRKQRQEEKILSLQKFILENSKKNQYNQIDKIFIKINQQLKMALSDRIKKLDFMKIIPDQMKQASYLGIVFSILFVTVIIFLLLNQLIGVFSYNVESQLLIDHFKDDQDMKITLDISLINYPCAMISLDKMDVLHTHIMDVSENLKKIRINSKQVQLGVYKNKETLSVQDRVKIIKKQVNNKEGCRLQGDFYAKQVPGNFHIAMHNYVAEYQYLIQQNIYRPDFDHIIHKLEFGIIDSKTSRKIQKDFNLKQLDILKRTQKTNLMNTLGFPHGVNYSINIVPSKFDYGQGKIYELFQYTADSYQIQMGSMRITFEFDIENFYMNYKIQQPNYSHIFIQILSIIGGFYTVLMVLKSFLEDGLINMAFKKRIGKLD